ncbi:MAG: DUF502 domain-containing protein [Steroidobacteraceae bacterium]
MRVLWDTFLKGLVAVLPVSLTIYVVYWIGTTAERMLGGLLRLVLPEAQYRPGLGLVVGFVVVFLIGLVVNAYFVSALLRLGESLLGRIPVVKTIFGAFKDFTRFLPSSGEGRDLKRVVLWRMGQAELIGFVTEEHTHAAIAQRTGDAVAVYFPMSYQIGGYTLYLPRDQLEPLEIRVEEAMRLVLIGGVTAHQAESGVPRG